MNMRLRTIVICCTLLAACVSCSQQTATPPPAATPTATTIPQPQPAPTARAIESQTDSSADESLEDIWRYPVQNAITLFTACQYMFETQYAHQQGDIDLEKAKTQWSIESDLLVFTVWDVPAAYHSDATATLMLRLEDNMRTLIELIDATDDEDMGSAETRDALLPICTKLQDLQTEVVFAAMDAGLSEAAIEELDPSDSELFTDFYDRISTTE
jgi:hypothetical protein